MGWGCAYDDYVPPPLYVSNNHCVNSMGSFLRDYARIEPNELGGGLGIKVLFANRETYYLNTQVFSFHYPFCTQYLGENRAIEDFNKQVYTGIDRSRVYGTIIAYDLGTENQFAVFELNPADPLNNSPEQVIEAFNAFKSSLGIPLHFHPTSPEQLARTKEWTSIPVTIPVITSEQLFGKIGYQCNQTGTVVGTVRLVTEVNHETLSSFGPRDIVVMSSVPSDIQAVGAVICQQQIPSLCHVSLLCQNRGTPCAFILNVFENPLWKLMNGTIVKLCIGKHNYTLETLTVPYLEYAHFKMTSITSLYGTPTQAQSVSVPIPNASEGALLPMDEVMKMDKQQRVAVVGAKASQYATISKYCTEIAKAPVIPSFVIPMAHYLNHVQSLGESFHQFLNTLLTMDLEAKDRHELLAELQQQIMNHPVDNELIQQVKAMLTELRVEEVIFRSSTNAEDLEGFNGAGLYESVPLYGQSDTEIGKAIAKVWSSVWYQRAFEERKFFGINQKNVGMAILVQGFLATEEITANGVALTCNPYNPSKVGILVHALSGVQHRVTESGAIGGPTPEQTIIHTSRVTGANDVQLIRCQSLSTHRIITEDFAPVIRTMFEGLHEAMLSESFGSKQTKALDIEFLLQKSKQHGEAPEIIILQARPYNIKPSQPELLVLLNEEQTKKLRDYADIALQCINVLKALEIDLGPEILSKTPDYTKVAFHLANVYATISNNREDKHVYSRSRIVAFLDYMLDGMVQRENEFAHVPRITFDAIIRFPYHVRFNAPLFLITHYYWSLKPMDTNAAATSFNAIEISKGALANLKKTYKLMPEANIVGLDKQKNPLHRHPFSCDPKTVIPDDHIYHLVKASAAMAKGVATVLGIIEKKPLAKMKGTNMAFALSPVSFTLEARLNSSTKSLKVHSVIEGELPGTKTWKVVAEKNHKVNAAVTIDVQTPPGQYYTAFRLSICASIAVTLEARDFSATGHVTMIHVLCPSPPVTEKPTSAKAVKVQKKAKKLL